MYQVFGKEVKASSPLDAARKWLEGIQPATSCCVPVAVVGGGSTHHYIGYYQQVQPACRHDSLGHSWSRDACSKCGLHRIRVTLPGLPSPALTYYPVVRPEYKLSVVLPSKPPAQY